MSYQMKLDEMQEALNNADHPQAGAFETALCSIGDAMAEALSATFDVEIGETTQEGVGFAGICCPFNPRYRNQPLPDAMANFDDDEAWSEAAEDKDLPPMPRGKNKPAARASRFGSAVIKRIGELRAERDGWVSGAPDGSETPDPEGWERANEDDAGELALLERIEREI